MTQTPMQKAVEAGRKAVVNAPEKCPIGISPESHIFCSAGYCATCADHRMSLALTAALASLEADGWKLMPREATKEMVKAYNGGLRRYINSVPLHEREAKWKPPRKGKGYLVPDNEKCIARYTAMFNAAPEVE